MKFILTNFGDEACFKSHHMIGGRKYGPHVHQFVEICFVMKGEAAITVDGIKKLLTRGDFAVIHPFRTHFVQSMEGGRMWIGVISDKLINGFGTQTSEYVWGEDFVFSGSESLINYVSEHLPPESDEHTAVEFNSSLMYNMRAVFNSVMEEYTRKIPQTKSPAYSTALARIYEYIEKHFNENIEIKDISATLGYSPKYISHTISSIPNSSFRKILNSRRVTNAKWWLLNSEKNVIEIALLVGYTQERTFYRAFKEETGMTPFKYRKRYKK